MAVKTKLEISTFIKGLITEASPLTFPDNASLVDENFVLNKDGSRQRRLGLDFEDDYDEDFYTGVDPAVLASYIWKNPTKTGSFDIVVIQEDDELLFYNANAPVISSAPLNVDGFGIGQPVVLPGAYVTGTPLVTASLRGQFVVAYGGSNVYLLTYDEGADTISVRNSRLQVRDVWGVEDGYDIDERRVFTNPIVTLTDDEGNHVYNLRNQGWPMEAKIVTTPEADAVDIFDPIIMPLHEPGDPNEFAFPSHADVFFYGKTDSAEIQDAVGAFSPYTLRKQLFGNTPAPKGKFVIDIFERGADRQAHFNENIGDVIPLPTDVPEDTSVGGITQVAAYAGRFFYAVEETSVIDPDNNTPRINTMILFSQVIKSDNNVGACYSEADPTSEHIFDPVDTDGGFLFIPDAGKILRLAPLGESLFVICSNGVWEIHGGERAFSATNVNLAKTTSIGGISGLPVVVSESVLTYWADGGIYLISIDPGSLRGLANNISVNTIQTLYKSIPISERKKSVGVFDEVDRKIRWLFNTTPATYPRMFLKELVFDVDLRAFYVNSFSPPTGTGAYGLVGVFTIPELRYVIQRRAGSSVFYSFGYYKNTDFLDFNNHDAKARLLTGYLTGGTGSVEKKIGDLVTHFKRTETGFQDYGSFIDFTNPGGCLITSQWEWTNSAAANRWGTPFQAYTLPRAYYPTGVDDPFDYGYTVVTGKHNLRGKGRALSLLFESEIGKDLHILGWGLEITVDEKL